MRVVGLGQLEGGKTIENHQPVEVDRGRLQPSSMPVEGDAELQPCNYRSVGIWSACYFEIYIVYIYLWSIIAHMGYFHRICGSIYNIFPFAKQMCECCERRTLKPMCFQNIFLIPKCPTHFERVQVDNCTRYARTEKVSESNTTTIFWIFRCPTVPSGKLT